MSNIALVIFVLQYFILLHKKFWNCEINSKIFRDSILAKYSDFRFEYINNTRNTMKNIEIHKGMHSLSINILKISGILKQFFNSFQYWTFKIFQESYFDLVNLSYCYLTHVCTLNFPNSFRLICIKVHNVLFL